MKTYRYSVPNENFEGKLHEVTDVHEFPYSHPEQLDAFLERVWPRLRELIRAELKAEQEARSEAAAAAVAINARGGK